MSSDLKKHRIQLGLTQTQLAQRVGTSQAQIYRLENSERKLTVEWAERLAPALCSTAEALLFGDRPVRQRPARPPGRIPEEDRTVISECLAFTDALESQADRSISREERAAYIVKLYNIYVETGQMPHRQETIDPASVAALAG